MSRNIRVLYPILLMISLFLVAGLSGCTVPADSEQQPANAAAAEPVEEAAAEPEDVLPVTLSEMEGEINVRLPGQEEFVPLDVDSLLEGSLLQVAADGRARLDLANDTIVRLDGTTRLKLDEQAEDGEGWHARLNLAAGRIWVILADGWLEVEMPEGTARVSGSYMSVEYDDETGTIRVTCLEGNCSLESAQGRVEFSAGQTAFVSGASDAPETGEMSEEDFQAWLDANPEAALVMQDMAGTNPEEGGEDGNASGGSQPQASVASSAAPVDFTYGPEMDNFPPGINPLTCEAVENEELLDLPAVLMSVTDYPPKVRPQSGLSYVSQIYEIYIGEGMTRFLASWYARSLDEKANTSGDRPVNNEVFVKTGVVLGDRVWFDIDMDGIQDADEAGVGGVAVDLLDAASGDVLHSTTTNSGGYFAFNVEDGEKYRLRVVLPPGFAFSPAHAGNDELADSDVDEASGETEEISMTADDQQFWDAGMYRLSQLSLQDEQEQKAFLLGDWVWVDLNKNGIQDAGEYGAGGVEVVVMDKGFNILQTTVTDFSGLYWLDVDAGEYVVRFNLPDQLSEYSFSPQFAGDDPQADSDVNAKGWTDIIEIGADTQGLDVGLMPPPPRPVGPARSGRQAFTPVVDSFGPDSCLIAASKDPTVRVNLCRYVYGSPDDIATAGINPSDLLKISEDSKQFDRDPNYAGNMCSTVVPDGGKAAQELLVFFSQKNQSIYRFDDLQGKYVRFDDREAEGVGGFVTSTDRLTGEPLTYGNVVILVVPHVVDRQFVFSLDMTGQKGKAIVFRDGQVFDQDVIWTTVGEEYEKEENMRRPVKLRYSDGTPFPLAPGNTWFIMSNTDYDLWEPEAEGFWKYRYYVPAGVG